jgi:hypothetical protein
MPDLADFFGGMISRGFPFCHAQQIHPRRAQQKTSTRRSGGLQQPMRIDHKLPWRAAINRTLWTACRVQ